MIFANNSKKHLMIFISVTCSLLLFASIVHSVENEEVDDANDSSLLNVPVCTKNGTIPLNVSIGSLKFQVKDGEELNCIWEIEINNTVAKPLFFRFNGFQLSNDDMFNITRDNQLLYNSTSSSVSNSIFFTGLNKGTVKVQLYHSKTKLQRLFHVEFNWKTNEYTLPVTAANLDGLFKFPVFNNTFKSDVSTIDFTLDVVLQEPLVNEYKLVVGMDQVKLEGGTLEVQGSMRGGTYSDSMGDFIASDKQITLILKKFTLSKTDQIVMIHYEVYSKWCTDYKKLPNLKAISLHTPDPKYIKEAPFNCLYIVESDDAVNYVLDYKELYFMSSMDTFTFRSGNRRNTPIVATVNNKNKFNLQNSYRDKISMGKNLYITYNSHFGLMSSYKVSSIDITPMKYGGYFTEPTTVQFQEKTENPIIYVYNTDDKRATLEFKSGVKLQDGFLKVYASDLIANIEPIIQFTAGDEIPRLIVSPSKIMRLDFENVTKFSGDLKNTSSVLNQVAQTITDSFTVTGSSLRCATNASWLIPRNMNPKASETLFTVQIPYLFLNTSDDSLTLTQYSNKITKISEITGQDDNGVASLPNVKLFANASYLFEYKRSKTCDPNYSSIMLQLSYTLNTLKDYENIVTMKSGETVVIKPDTYPNYYPLRAKDLNEYCMKINRGGWRIDCPKDKNLLVTFTDLDVVGGDRVVIKQGGAQPEYFFGKLPNDKIYEDVYVQMDVPLNATMKLSQHLSGRGFKLQVKEFDCGGMLEYPHNKSLVIKPTNKSCVWIVSVKPGTKNSEILNFTVNFANEGKGENLTIIDAPTIRDWKVLPINMSLVYQPASVNRTIIIYEVTNPAKAAGLNITWKVDDCPNNTFCKNDFTRCIIPTWRCDGQNQCGDWSDEMNCNNTGSGNCPKPPDAPAARSGVNGWVIALVIVPLAMIVGVILQKFGPNVIRRFRGSSYQEFRDFSEVS